MNTKPKLKHFLWDFVKKCKREIIIFYLIMIISDSLYLILAGHILKIITNKAKDNDFDNLILYSILFCFLLTIGHLSKMCYRQIGYEIRKKIDRYYVLKLFRKTLEHENSYFADNLTGQLTSKIFNIQSKLENIVDNLVNTTSNILAYTVGLIVFYFIDPKLSYFGLVWIIIYLPIFYLLLQWNFKLSNENSEKITKSVGIINDCFTNVMNIKIFSNERREFRTIKRQSSKILRSESKKLFSNNIIEMYSWIGAFALSFGLLSIAFLGFMNGKTSAGSFLFIASFTFDVVIWLNFAIWNIISITTDMAVLSNSVATLLIEPKIKNKEKAIILKNATGQIEFKNINFSYIK